MEDFTTILQLRNEGRRLQNGTHVPRGGFASVKIFTEGGNWAAKWFRSKVAISQRTCWGCEMVSQQRADFAEAFFRLRNFADPCFYTFYCSKRRPSFNFFAIPLDFDHPKTYIKSKQIRINTLKSKLKY